MPKQSKIVSELARPRARDRAEIVKSLLRVGMGKLAPQGQIVRVSPSLRPKTHQRVLGVRASLAGDFADELAQHRVAETAEVVDRHDEGAGPPPDHVLAV